MSSNKSIILTALLAAAVFTASGQMSREDSLYFAESMRAIDSAVQSRKFMNRVSAYYDKADKETGKKFDMTFGGAPFYKSATGLGIGGIATGLYRMDTLSMRSDICIIGKVTLTGFYTLEAEGRHNCLGDIIRMSYGVEFSSFPQHYWGQGFSMGDDDANRTDMTRKTFHASLEPGFRLAKGLYAGPKASYDWVLGKNMAEGAVPEGVHKRISALGLGAFLTYDTRDVTYNAFRGVYLSAGQMDYINFGNKPLFKTIGDFRAYIPAWKDAIIAVRGYVEYSYGTVPWTMTARGDGSTLMRSYYEGRYEDESLISATIELRQRIWQRLGAVAWVGAGNFFGKEAFDWKHTLSDLGIGLRWEFKKRMNIRFDCGFGRCGQYSLLFGVREAF